MYFCLTPDSCKYLLRLLAITKTQFCQTIQYDKRAFNKALESEYLTAEQQRIFQRGFKNCIIENGFLKIKTFAKATQYNETTDFEKKSPLPKDAMFDLSGIFDWSSFDRKSFFKRFIEEQKDLRYVALIFFTLGSDIIMEYPFRVCTTFIECMDIDPLIHYWESRGEIYSKIDKDASWFLCRCMLLKRPQDKEDPLRTDLLNYLMELIAANENILSKQEKLHPFCRHMKKREALDPFYNREIQFKKDIANFKKKTSFFETKDGEKILKKGAYRSHIKDRLFNICYSKGDKYKVWTIMQQMVFSTIMDEMDWDLLLRYTYLTEDSNSAEMKAKVLQKVDSLMDGDKIN